MATMLLSCIDTVEAECLWTTIEFCVRNRNTPEVESYSTRGTGCFLGSLLLLIYWIATCDFNNMLEIGAKS